MWLCGYVDMWISGYVAMISRGSEALRYSAPAFEFRVQVFGIVRLCQNELSEIEVVEGTNSKVSLEEVAFEE